MLLFKTRNYVEKVKELKKKIHVGIMSDSLETMDDYTFNLLKDSMEFIDLSLELIEEQNKTLSEVNRKLDDLLVKVES